MKALIRCAAALVAAGYCVVAAQAPVDVPVPQFRSTADGVRIDVDVMDGSRPVTGLRAQDFQVVDEGVVQQVESARAVGKLSIALVADVSFSVRPAGPPLIRQALSHAIEALRVDDRAAVVAFSDRVRQLSDLTTDRMELQRAISSVADQSAGVIPRSVTWDAVFAAASLVGASDGRPVVVLLGDGMDNASGLKQAEVARTLSRAGVVVDFVRAPMDPGSFDFFPPGRNAPEDLVREARGVEFKAGDDGLGGRIRSRFEALRQGYVLTYSPRGVSAIPGWHRLTVRVPGRTVSVRARPGYFATKPAGG